MKITFRRNIARNGLEILFDEIPTIEIVNYLKQKADFIYNGKNPEDRFWYHRYYSEDLVRKTYEYFSDLGIVVELASNISIGKKQKAHYRKVNMIDIDIPDDLDIPVIEIKQEPLPIVMEDYVFLNDAGDLVTSSLLVAKAFGKRHSHVLRDIKELDCSNEFRESNFGLLVNMRKLPQGGEAKEVQYQIKKDGFSFLVMGYRGEKASQFKESFIKEFNRMESSLKNLVAQNTAIPDFRNPAEAARAWADQFERVQLLDKQVKELAPNAEFAKSVMASETTITVNDLAKLAAKEGIDIGEGRLYQWMRYKGFVCSRTNIKNRPMQTEINGGFLQEALVWVEHLKKYFTVAMITPAGIRKYMPLIICEFPKRKNVLT